MSAWTTEEERLVREAYAANSGKKSGWLISLALELGRIKSNVCRKAREMGLKTDRNRNNGGKKPRPRSVFERKGRWSRPGQTHPRGMLGKHHTPDVCAKMSLSRTGTKRKPFTEETRMRMSMAMVRRLRGKPDSVNPGKHGKGGRRVDLGGRYFRSSYEANYARYLNFRKIAWEYETKTFRFEKISRGTMSYTPDFFLTEEGEYHEVKGWMDPKSQTKLARMTRYFPGAKIVVIGADWFRSAERQGLCAIIPGWECRHTAANIHARGAVA